MIAIVDYEAGNIKSVTNALERLGVEFTLTADPDAIRKADKVVLPGVGNAAAAMASLRAKGLEPVIRSLRQPVLGICVGMQLMCRRSEEGGVACMDIFDCEVKRFAPEPGIKVPHMGWNTLGIFPVSSSGAFRPPRTFTSYTLTMPDFVRTLWLPAATDPQCSAPRSNTRISTAPSSIRKRAVPLVKPS